MANDTMDRLDLLDQYVRDLSQAQAPTFEAYENDKMLRRYTERVLHIAIDTAIQIAIGILTSRGCRDPENYHDVFAVLGEQQILPQRLVNSMTSLVEFRNVLVYEHESVDDVVVYGLVKKRLQNLVDFSDVIRRCLNGSSFVNSSPDHSPRGDAPATRETS